VGTNGYDGHGVSFAALQVGAIRSREGTIVTASITNESVDELKLVVGQSAYAVIKAPDVMIGVD
jgi:molybdopterin-binding protein